MALPPSFADDTEYFEEAMNFLELNQHYYNYPNTDVLIEGILEKLDVPGLDKLNVFDPDFKIHDVPELKSVLDSVDRFKYHHVRQKFEDIESVYFDNVPLGPKKKHEILYLSQGIHSICQELECNIVVDFGCGLGYLDQLLHKKFNYRILGLEYNDNLLRGVRKRQKKYHKESMDNVKYVKHFVDGDSNETIEKLLEEHFPGDKKVCIVGLHACADLTVDAINMFLKIKDAKCLVLMPCCYHKMCVKEVVNKEKDSGGNCYFQDEDSNSVKSNKDNIDAITQNESEFKSKITEPQACNPKMDKSKCQLFRNFPLSDKFRSIYAAKQGFGYLRIPFLRLAAQPASVDEDLGLLVFRLLSRAVLQLYCYKHNQRLVKKKRRAVKTNDHTKDFQTYLKDATENGFSLKCNNESCPLTTLDSGEESPHSICKCEAAFDIQELTDMWRSYCNDVAVRKAAILVLMQRHLQPMFENLVLYDRIVYLKEKGLENCKFLKVVDERISPRCLALVAAK